MSNVLLIFSLGPVQGFLAEARRAQDLWAGSKWLSDLARAAIQACEQAGGKVIYPANPNAESLPNKFVIRLPEAKLKRAVEVAQQAVQEELRRRAEHAKQFLQAVGVPTDDVWKAIWERQLTHHLEFFWGAATLNGDYQKAYQQASRAFDAAKRTRIFHQVYEEGRKDSLSGRRSALHTKDLDATAYWREVGKAKRINPAQLKPDGRERLDALGAAKRFGFGKEAERFPSVSSVAVAEFLSRAQSVLEPYRQILEQIPLFYKVRDDSNWPYDGDLLFKEALSPERLRASYGFKDEDFKRYGEQLENARNALHSIYNLVGKPTPYYAILVMDGDSMGERVAGCATEEEHRTLSERLVAFAAKATQIVERHQGRAVYTGGDDVLALLPLSQALPAARELAETFAQIVPNGTVSAGIALVHHLYPLDAALRAAREAESRRAKDVPGKNAVCVRTLKRSGETTEVRSHWSDLGTLFEDLCGWFASGALSSRFAYEASENLRVLAGLKDEPLRSELKRLVRRHRDERKPDTPDPKALADRLATWAGQLPGGAEELGRWILLARFVAQGGGE